MSLENDAIPCPCDPVRSSSAGAPLCVPLSRARHTPGAQPTQDSRRWLRMTEHDRNTWLRMTEHDRNAPVRQRKHQSICPSCEEGEGVGARGSSLYLGRGLTTEGTELHSQTSSASTTSIEVDFRTSTVLSSSAIPGAIRFRVSAEHRAGPRFCADVARECGCTGMVVTPVPGASEACWWKLSSARSEGSSW